MSSPRNCPTCGKPIPGDAPGGLCPQCLIQGGVGSQPGPGVGSQSTAPSNPSRTPPPIPELAPLFPQLEILELLGQGGMGIVYKARQLHLDRWVALKILPADSSRDPAFAERFTREARALARLSHPNIVGIHDFGQAGGFCYIIMEFVDGMNLRQLEQSRTLTPAEALALIPKICEALQYAHDEGFVHRDIKPGNILIDRKGRVKIADFGLAKLMDASPEDPTLTASHHVMGTPHYMAPEQMEHPQDVDHRADIYSLGVVLYEMLTGQLPLGRFAPPSQRVQVDVRLDEIVLKALENQPDLRYQHVRDVQTDIETLGTQPSVTAPKTPPRPSPAPAPPTNPSPQPTPSTRPWRLLWITATVAAIALAALQLRVSYSSARLDQARAEWAQLEALTAPVHTNLARLREIRARLNAIDQFREARFRWSELIAAIQASLVPNLRIATLSAFDRTLDTLLPPPAPGPTKPKSGIGLTIVGTEPAPQPGDENDTAAHLAFIEALRKQPRLQPAMPRPDNIRLTQLGQPFTDKLDNQRRRQFLIEITTPSPTAP